MTQVNFGTNCTLDLAGDDPATLDNPVVVVEDDGSGGKQAAIREAVNGCCPCHPLSPLNNYLRDSDFADAVWQTRGPDPNAGRIALRTPGWSSPCEGGGHGITSNYLNDPNNEPHGLEAVQSTYQPETVAGASLRLRLAINATYKPFSNTEANGHREIVVYSDFDLTNVLGTYEVLESPEFQWVDIDFTLTEDMQGVHLALRTNDPINQRTRSVAIAGAWLGKPENFLCDLPT